MLEFVLHLERSHNERPFENLWLLKLFDHSSHLFQISWQVESVAVNWILRLYNMTFRLLFGFNVSIKLPNLYAIFLSCCVDHTIVLWLEHASLDRESVSDECLVVVGVILAGFRVPYFDQFVVSTREYVLIVA